MKWYWKCVASYSFISQWEHTSWRWIGSFLLTQTSWLWRGYNLHWHITFGCEQVLFIHLYFSSIHPCTCGKIFLHVMIYFIPCVKEYFSNIPLTLIKYSKKIPFCSFAHAHLFTFMLQGSPFNIPPCKLPSNYTKK